MRVGVFDSGIGGLSVVKSLLEHKLFSEIIYYGDTARVPYGSKDKNTIIRYAIEAVEFFKNFDIDMIIVACNSVSAFALEEMREASTIPVVGVVEAGILATANKLQDKSKKILILGTKATISSKAYEDGLLRLGYTKLFPKATPLFVPLVEEGIFEGAILESCMQHYFSDISSPDAIILGCTHFPLIETKISSYFDHKPVMIHSGEAIVEYLEKNFDFEETFAETSLKFFASENPTSLKEVAKVWLDLK
jgi:glutamate racemase